MLLPAVGDTAVRRSVPGVIVDESSGPGQGQAGRRFLVTMAVDRYPYLDEADSLARPVRDAERVAGLLRPHGYEHALGIGNYWGAQQVRASLSHWSKDTGFGEDDVLVFYFAGHGLVEDRDRHYLMCWDSSEDDPAATALATEDVVRTLTRHGPRRPPVGPRHLLRGGGRGGRRAGRPAWDRAPGGRRRVERSVVPGRGAGEGRGRRRRLRRCVAGDGGRGRGTDRAAAALPGPHRCRGRGEPPVRPDAPAAARGAGRRDGHRARAVPAEPGLPAAPAARGHQPRAAAQVRSPGAARPFRPSLPRRGLRRRTGPLFPRAAADSPRAGRVADGGPGRREGQGGHRQPRLRQVRGDRADRRDVRSRLP